MYIMSVLIPYLMMRFDCVFVHCIAWIGLIASPTLAPLAIGWSMNVFVGTDRCGSKFYFIVALSIQFVKRRW